MRWVFKKECLSCGIKWDAPKEFIRDTNYLCDASELGLALRNCKGCDTTLGVAPEALYPDRACEFQKLWDSDPKYWLVKKIRAKKEKEEAESDRDR